MNDKLKDFISKLPSSVLLESYFDENIIKLPSEIEVNKFEKVFSDEIIEETLTDEKALYLAYLNRSKQTESVREQLFKVAFNKS